MKAYTIIKTHKGKTTEITGTMPELIEHFGYTLKAGASYNGQKGCKKVNESPKTIKSLMTALQNAVYNTQGSSYEQDSYDYIEAETKAEPEAETAETKVEAPKAETPVETPAEEPKKTKAAKATKTTKTTKAAKKAADPEAKTANKTAKTTKSAPEITVLLRTFTGLKIGIYTGKLNKKKQTITIHIGRVGDVEFNLDGTQKTLNPSKNPKFNNKIEIITEE